MRKLKGKVVENQNNDIPSIIKNPSHYSKYKIEPIEFILENEASFIQGNVIKYIMRAGIKLYPDASSIESKIIDYQKAIECLQLAIKHERSNL